MTEEAAVVGIDDTVPWALYERKTGTGLGVLRLEARVSRGEIPNLAKMVCHAVKGRPNFNLYVDNQPCELRVIRSGRVEEDEPSGGILADEESKLLVVQKEQLRVQIGAMNADLEARAREHDRMRQHYMDDIAALRTRLDQEGERLSKERERVDKAIKAMNEEVTQKQRALEKLGEFEEDFFESLKTRLGAVDGDYVDRMQDAREKEKEHRKALREAQGRVGEGSLRSEFVKYVRESAPPDLVKKGFDAGLERFLTWLGSGGAGEVKKA